MPSETKTEPKEYAVAVLRQLENIEEPWQLASDVANSSTRSPKPEVQSPSWRLAHLRESSLGNFIRGTRADLNAAEILLTATEIAHGAHEARRVLNTYGRHSPEEQLAIDRLGNAEAMLFDLPSQLLKMGVMSVGSKNHSEAETGSGIGGCAYDALKTLDQIGGNHTGVTVMVNSTKMPLDKSTPSFLLLRDMLTLLSECKVETLKASLVEETTKAIISDLQSQLDNPKNSDAHAELEKAIDTLSQLRSDLKELGALSSGRGKNGNR